LEKEAAKALEKACPKPMEKGQACAAQSLGTGCPKPWKRQQLTNLGKGSTCFTHLCMHQLKNVQLARIC